MIISVLLILVVGSVVPAEPPIHQIVSQLINARQVALPGANPTILFRSKEMSPTTEAILRGFVAESYDAVIIASRKDVYQERETLAMYFIVILEKRELFQVISLTNRQVVVIERKQFAQYVELMRIFKIRNVVYVVYDGESSSIVHSNQFLGRLESSLRLQVDPLFAATTDLAGIAFNVILTLRPDQRFARESLRRINASYELHNFGGITVTANHFRRVFYSPEIMTEFYMHRTDFCHVLVPKLNLPKPLLFMLIDPFDLSSWLLILATIFALAFFRSMISKTFTTLQFSWNLLDILDSVTTGSALPNFHRDLERQIFGLVLLLFVVLINAYQSLVISYLLSPRFYPELDTLALLNESCCWDNDPAIAEFNLRRFGECSSEYLRKFSDPDVVEANQRMLCLTVDSSTLEMIHHHDMLHSYGRFRWSKQNLNEVPMVMLVMKDPVIAERVQLLSALHFAEGALEKRFQGMDGDVPNVAAPRRFSVDDLLLVWVVYGIGIAVGIASFLVEIVYHMIVRKTQFLIAV